MTSDESTNQLKVMVLSDLATICKKISENPVVPSNLRTRAHEFVEEYNSLLAFCGKGDPTEHFLAEALLIRMARFLPSITEVHSWPANSRNLNQ